jgi:hypothetical protein
MTEWDLRRSERDCFSILTPPSLYVGFSPENPTPGLEERKWKIADPVPTIPNFASDRTFGQVKVGTNASEVN